MISSQKATKASRVTTGTPSFGASSPRIRAAAKRTSAPTAMKCAASRSGISRRMSSTTLWMYRTSSRAPWSWLPCHEARLWRMRIDPRG